MRLNLILTMQLSLAIPVSAASINQWQCQFADSAGQKFHVTLSRSKEDTFYWNAKSDSYDPMYFRAYEETAHELVLVLEDVQAKGLTVISKKEGRHASVIIFPSFTVSEESTVIRSDGTCD